MRRPGLSFGQRLEGILPVGDGLRDQAPAGLVESDRIDPIFTPATKAETGHDENVPFEVMAGAVGTEVAETLRVAEHGGLPGRPRSRPWKWADPRRHQVRVGLRRPDRRAAADRRGADARQLAVLVRRDRTSRGGPQPSFDKQFVRDWLETTSWDKASPPPALPDDVVARTRRSYIEAFEGLTGRAFPWK